MKIHLTDKEMEIWEESKHVFSFIFQALLLLFLICLLLREFYPDVVTAYLNVNWFMAVVILFGALSILFPAAKQDNANRHDENRVTKKDLALIIVLGILGTIIVFLKIRSLGWIGYVISILGGLIIVLLSWLLLTEKENSD